MIERDYPSFSEEEFSRRLEAVRDVLRASALSALVVYGSGRAGAEIQYLTNWIVQREGVLIVPTDGPLALYVQYYNHVPNARRISIVSETAWAGPDTMVTVGRRLREVAPGPSRVGVVGPLGYRQHQTLRDMLPDVELVDMTTAFVRIRLTKSAEEIDWLRRAARISDEAVRWLVDKARPGMSDQAVAGLIDAAHRSAGGLTQIAFLASTAMADPHVLVPAQQPSSRVLRRGDVVIAEISGQYWGYAGQVLRTFSIASKPTPPYSELHEVALEAFHRICRVIRPGATSQEAADAAALIKERGFDLCDDLIHGYGGGYLPPIIRAYDIEQNEIAPFVFEPGMVVVVQPNVVSRDRSMGVQVGEMMLVTESGVERMHEVPLELLQCG